MFSVDDIASHNPGRYSDPAVIVHAEKCILSQPMAREWEPDWVVDRELAELLIDEHWPVLAPASARELGAGWDNTVYLVNDEFVFRFPRRRIAVPLLETELNLLPWLVPHLPIAIPNPCFAGRASARYPCSFLGYRWIPGVAMTGLNLSPTERALMARPLAGFLAALHAVPAGAAQSRGAPEDVFQRLDVGRRKARTDAQLTALVRSGQIADRRPIDELLESLPVIENPTADSVVHGDLHRSQVVVNERHELVGVIDWGDVHVGDPAVDFAGVHTILPKWAHDEFFEFYGPIDARTWAAARGRAIWHTVMVLAQASDTGNVPATVEAQSCLAELVAEGRRGL
jgi:aminoglycoside phosphotransferase (APT) family kinase protein